MKNLTEYTSVNEARVDWRNVHDAILNVLQRYCNKVGVSQEVRDYCDKVREALNNIKR